MKIYKKLILLTFTAWFVAGIPAFAGGGHDHGHAHHGQDEEEERGPHGGRLLKKGDFALELKIFEDGVPPRFRVYIYEDGEPIEAADASVAISLTRFGGGKEVYDLRPADGYLTLEKEVSEPHSFKVQVKAEWKGEKFEWHYDSYEGRTTLTVEAIRSSGLAIDTAGPRAISDDFTVYGRILLNENKTAHLSARFPGVIRAMKKQLGDKVKKDEVLAIIESNQSLQTYELRSLTDGEVIARHGTVGEFVSAEQEIYVVSDLSEVWADFQVYRDNFGVLSRGAEIEINLGGAQKILEARIDYVSPVMDESTQSRLVRAVVPNPDGLLRPGLFVSGRLTTAETEVPLAVHREAIQTFRDWNVVYLTDGHVFQAMPVEIGRKDSEYVEILSGIKAGDRYASKNSFIVKADVEKAGASHDH